MPISKMPLAELRRESRFGRVAALKAVILTDRGPVKPGHDWDHVSEAHAKLFGEFPRNDLS